MYYHGEEIGVNVHIANSSSKTCKKIKITGKLIFFLFMNANLSRQTLARHCFSQYIGTV